MHETLDRWNGLGVVVRRAARHDAWIFVALHDRTLGTPTGGTRLRVYDRPEDGLVDATRLAEGMTWKWASIGLPFGGGKAVLALSHPLSTDDRRSLLAEYGRLIEGLCGAFATGEDLGTTPEDMTFLARYTRHVHGSGKDGGAVDPGPYTARGVQAGMHAAVAHAFGERTLRGRSILIQGVGDVGRPLARLCAAEGASLLLSDLDPTRAARLAAEIDGQVVPADRVFETPCDVFAPCAIGAVLDARSIPRLQCRVVAGSANNQLADATDADRLHDAGILYAPDYVVNGGGALAFGLMSLEGLEDDALFPRIEGLEGALDEIFTEASRNGESPHHAAQRRARRVIDERRPTD